MIAARGSSRPENSGQLELSHGAVTIDFEQAAMGDFRCFYRGGEFDAEFQLLGQADRIEHDRQPWMTGRPAADLAKVFGIARHDDPILGDRAGEHVGIGGTLQADFVHMDRLVAVNGTEMMGQLRREILVD